MKIQIQINGQQQEATTGSTLAELVEVQGWKPEHIVIEYNGTIPPRPLWEKIILQPEDQLEILSFVGGG